MSGYGKNQEQYAYGKCIAAHMTGWGGQMPLSVRVHPVEVHVRAFSKFD